MNPEEEIDSGGQGFLMLRGLIIPLPKDRDTILGRDKSMCDVVLAHEHVSKQHSTISYRGGRYFLTDMGSLNGTFINKRRVDGSTALVAGDEISLPPYMMLFFGPEHPEADEPSAPSVPAAQPVSREGQFSGLLGTLRITDLIQLLNSTAQSGLLRVRDPRKREAVLTFSKGEIVNAQYGEHKNEFAVYALLYNTTGEFEFLHGDPVPSPHAITMNTLSLLLEGCRRLDESPQQQSSDSETIVRDETQTTRIPLVD